MNTNQSNKKGMHGGVSLIYTQRKRSFHLIVLTSNILRSLFLKMITKYSIRYFMVLKNLIKETINESDNSLSFLYNNMKR